MDETEIREYPSTFSDIIDTVGNGDTLLVGAYLLRRKENNVKHGWVYIETSDHTKGWVEDDFIIY